MTKALETFLGRLTNVVVYHVFVFLLLACNFFPIAFNHWVMTFYGYEPQHSCKMPEGWAWHRNDSIPIVFSNGQGQFHKCDMYKDPENHALGNKECLYGWEYHVTPPEWPIVAEWNLVCKRSHLVRLAYVLYFVGCLLGAVTFGTLADRFGRRPIMFICLFGQTIAGIVIFFVRRFTFFTTLRFFQGIFIQGLECSTFVMVIELFQPKYRTLAGSGCFIAYAVGMIFLGLLAYGIQYWRYIQLAISVPSLIGVLYLCLIPESLRWLIVSMKADDVTSALKKTSRFTAKPMEQNIQDSVECLMKEIELDAQLNCDVRDLFKSSILRRFTLFHCFCWLSASLIYSTLSETMPEMNGNRYINFVIVGVIELFSHLSALISLQRFGRRRPLFLFFIVGGILSISSVIVEHLAKSQSESGQKIALVLAVFGKFCITSCISGLYIFSSETFPTVLRTIGIGVCCIWKIAGILLAPWINLLGLHTLKAIPIILVGAVSMVAAFVVLMLPETRSKSLPDTIVESEDLGQQKTISPFTDKTDGPAGKVNPVAEPPKTPPLKRTTPSWSDGNHSEDSPDDDSAKDNDSSGTETSSNEKRATDDIKAEKQNRHNNRIVRFLGIDVLDDKSQQRHRKKSTGSNDVVALQERRVRFSNVVHDIDGLLAAIHACAERDRPVDQGQPNVQGKDDSSSSDQRTSDSLVGNSDISVTVAEASTSSSSEMPVDVVRPVVGILKKSSQDETCKKIVRSPHPVRKNSPNKNEFSVIDPNPDITDKEIAKPASDEPQLLSAKVLDIEVLTVSRATDNDDLTSTNDGSGDEQKSEGSEEEQPRPITVIGLSPALIRLKRRLPPPDDGTRTPPSSSSGEPTPEGCRKALQSDDTVNKSDTEESGEEQQPPASTDTGTCEKDGGPNGTKDETEKDSPTSTVSSYASHLGIPNDDVAARKRKLSVYEMGDNGDINQNCLGENAKLEDLEQCLSPSV